MPKVDRKCTTPGCIAEKEVVNTGLRACIFCQRELTVIERNPTTEISTLYPGIVDGMAGYLGYVDDEES